MWAVRIAVTVAIALVSVWVHFASDTQFDALLVPATRDAIHFVLFVLWVAGKRGLMAAYRFAPKIWDPASP
jgi:hypothetical protein